MSSAATCRAGCPDSTALAAMVAATSGAANDVPLQAAHPAKVIASCAGSSCHTPLT